MEFTLKSGTNKGNRRIWIEGERLTSAGLRRGMRLHRQMNADGSMTLSMMPASDAKRHTIAGTSDRPILDLCGKWVTAFIGDHSHFNVRVQKFFFNGGTDLIITPCNG